MFFLDPSSSSPSEGEQWAVVVSRASGAAEEGGACACSISTLRGTPGSERVGINSCHPLQPNRVTALS